ncbi:hypothetical protein [Pseudomonas fluorescens group sp. PF-69]
MSRTKPPTKAQQKAQAQKAKDEQNARKEAQRLRDKALGIERKELALSNRELDMVRFGCLVRGGLAEPYGLNEYLSTLIRRDYARLQEQLQDVQGQACGQCHKPLPQGCGGDHPGYATCWFKRGPASLLL